MMPAASMMSARVLAHLMIANHSDLQIVHCLNCRAASLPLPPLVAHVKHVCTKATHALGLRRPLCAVARPAQVEGDTGRQQLQQVRPEVIHHGDLARSLHVP